MPTVVYYLTVIIFLSRNNRICLKSLFRVQAAGNGCSLVLTRNLVSMDKLCRRFSVRRRWQIFVCVLFSSLFVYWINLQLDYIKRFHDDKENSDNFHMNYSDQKKIQHLQGPEACVPLEYSTKAPDLNLPRFGGKYMMNMEKERPLAKFAVEPWAVLDAKLFVKDCRISLDDVPSVMVHLVKSGFANKDCRSAIRNTWGAIKAYGKFRFGLVFILGLAPDKKQNDEILRESDLFGDILLINQLDSAGLVPEKVLAGMQWASNTLKSNVIYTSVDDDMLVHVPNLVTHIRTYTKAYAANNAIPCYGDLPIICTYSYQAKDIPSRKPDSKWYMPRDWYPNDTWPCYCRGGMYVAPVRIVRGLFQASRRTERLYLDDVWVTGFMRRKLGKGDTNIVPAPHSLRSDFRLRHDETDPDDVIVRHMWGNIAEKPVNVVELLYERYRVWKVDVTANGTCVGNPH